MGFTCISNKKGERRLNYFNLLCGVGGSSFAEPWWGWLKQRLCCFAFSNISASLFESKLSLQLKYLKNTPAGRRGVGLWSVGESNPWSLDCEPSALPTELTPLLRTQIYSFLLIISVWYRNRFGIWIQKGFFFQKYHTSPNLIKIQ